MNSNKDHADDGVVICSVAVGCPLPHKNYIFFLFLLHHRVCVDCVLWTQNK